MTRASHQERGDETVDVAFFARPTLIVARELLGCVVVSTIGGVTTSGRIVETEGYLDEQDLASHAGRLKRGRAAMSGRPGLAYVYRSMGIHAMLNVVTEGEGTAGAVLIRALEPIDGIETMRSRRGGVPDRLLCAGPGRLCQALGITLEAHGVDLTREDVLWIDAGERPASISTSGRIGISRAVEEPWRFFETDNHHVSVHRRGTI